MELMVSDGFAWRKSIKKVRAWLERHGFLFAVFCIIVATFIFFLGRDHLAKGTWALLYLPIIVLVASTSGIRPALVAALLAFLAWNFFFIPPYHTFRVNDPEDWISLFVFLLVGMAVGLQTGRMRGRESEALAREREAILLNRFSSNLVTQTTTAGMTEMLLKEISHETSAAYTALFLPNQDGKSICMGGFPASTEDTAVEKSYVQLAEWVYTQAKAIGLPRPRGITGMDAGGWPASVRYDEMVSGGTRNDIWLPLQTASRMEGVLYISEKADHSEYTRHDARMLVSIANLAAAFIERRRLQNMATQAEALSEADRLKSAFVSSVSHELKTPLASVTATVTSLLEEDVEWEPAIVHQELEAVRDDLSRLNDSINSLFDLARLEANAWSPQRDWYEIGEIIGSAVEKIAKNLRDRIHYSLPDDAPSIYVDFPQWASALRNILENALAYSGPDKPVCIGVSTYPQEVRIWVEDQGPGVAPEEQSKIFNKFYRGKASEKVPSGTGLGLAITREIVRSHGGRIWVENIQPHGLRVIISLPRDVQEN